MGKFIDLTGKRFGTRTIISYVGIVKNRRSWNCMCDCGKEMVLSTTALRSTWSCGCATKNKIHGLSQNKTYKLWKAMRKRCNNKKASNYSDYGGRGISVCEEWSDPVVFCDWCISNGFTEGLQIDRVDNDGNYEPSNCKFVTHRENSLNKRIRKTNTSGYEGINLFAKTNSFVSRIAINGNRIWLGSYSDKKQAVGARNNYILKNNIKHEYDIQEYRGE